MSQLFTLKSDIPDDLNEDNNSLFSSSTLKDALNSEFDFHELIVDSFAGGGGASTGIFMALGRHPDIAVNHDGEALAMHEANHPTTRHIREDVWALDPEKAMGYRQVGLLWASPDCKHFSKAKGGKPVSKKIRGLAWVITKWATKVRPRCIYMENVEEFSGFGPLVRRDGGWYPDPTRKGEYFKRFIARFRKLGYEVEWKELRACDYGAPTIRKRLFIIMRRDGLPIVWPSPTHGDPKSLPVQAGKLLPWRTAAECIDWSIQCPSIFDRKKSLADATLKRIAKGVHRYVINSAEPFVVNLTHQGGYRVEALDEPLRTVTGAKRGEKAIVTPVLVEAAHGEVSPSGVKRWGSGARSIEQPVPTVTASGSTQALASAVLAPFITEHANASHQRNMAANEPLRTQVAQVKGGHFAAVAATLVQTGYGEREGQQPRALDIQKPLGTVVGGGAKHALVSAFLAQHNTMPNGGVHPGRDPRDPVSTVIASGSQQAVVTSHLAILRNNVDAADMAEPLNTVSAGGQHHGEVRAFLLKYYSEGGQWQGCQEPMHTMPTNDRMAAVEAELSTVPFSPEMAVKARKVAELLRSHGLWDEREFVTVEIRGQAYVIVDLGMRMLTPRELATAQGFPLDYIIDRGADGKPLTKTAQVRMIGNSVCPPMAAAIVRANSHHERAAAAGFGRQRKRAEGPGRQRKAA